MLKDINNGTKGSSCDSGSSIGCAPCGFDHFDFLAVNPNLMVFKRSDGTSGCELWKTDGTSVGTTKVKDINPGNAGSYPSNFVYFNEKVFFQAYTPTFGFEMWYTDGTAEGTSLLKDVDTRSVSGPMGGTMFSGAGATTPLGAVVNSKLYYWSYSNTSSSSSFDFVLISSNGKRNGTEVVNKTSPIKMPWPNTYNFISYHDELYVVNYDNDLYVLTRTNELKKVQKNMRGRNGFPIVYGNKLFFVANNVSSPCSQCGDELYYLTTTSPTPSGSGSTTTSGRLRHHLDHRLMKDVKT